MDLFFLAGMGKSGTTWMQHALDKKKEIICKGEGKFLYNWRGISLYDLLKENFSKWYKFQAVRKNNWIGLDDHITTINKKNYILDDNIYREHLNEDFNGILEKIMFYFANNFMDKDTLLFGDKTPLNYMEELIRIRETFPYKKLIIMRRNLIDVFLARIYGWWKQNVADVSPTNLKHPHFSQNDYFIADKFLNGEGDYIADESSIASFAKGYSRIYTRAKQEQEKYPNLVKIVPFEEAVEDPIDTYSDILTFLGIDYKYDEVDKIIKSCEKGKIAELGGNINTEIDFSDHSSYLTDEMIDFMNRINDNIGR